MPKSDYRIVLASTAIVFFINLSLESSFPLCYPIMLLIKNRKLFQKKEISISSFEALSLSNSTKIACKYFK